MSRLAAAALLLALAACGAGEDAGPTELAEGPMAVRPLVPSMYRCAYAPAEDLVIRSSSKWTEVWDRASAELAQRPLPPPVDFSKEMILASFLGPGPAARAVSIQSVERQGDRIVVTVARRDGEGEPHAPGRREGPGAIVAVPRSDLPVEWRTARVEGD